MMSNWVRGLTVACVLGAGSVAIAGVRVPNPSNAQIRTWIKQLGDDNATTRERATKSLIDAGEPAYEAVTTAAKSEDPEVCARAERIADAIYRKIAPRSVEQLKKSGAKLSGDLPLNVTSVSFEGAELTEEDLAPLAKLPTIRGVYITKSKVADSSLKFLSALVNLRKLMLAKTNIDGSCLQYVVNSPSLEYISLNHCPIVDKSLLHLPASLRLRNLGLSNTLITDESLPHLAKFAEIRHLFAENTKITDAGIAHLNPTLTFLRLRGTHITDEGLKRLVKATPELRNLRIEETAVTGTGLSALRDLPKLIELDLEGCEISDKDLLPLLECKALQHLSLAETKVTPKGVLALRDMASIRQIDIPATFTRDEVLSLYRDINAKFPSPRIGTSPKDRSGKRIGRID